MKSNRYLSMCSSHILMAFIFLLVLRCDAKPPRTGRVFNSKTRVADRKEAFNQLCIRINSVANTFDKYASRKFDDNMVLQSVLGATKELHALDARHFGSQNIEKAIKLDEHTIIRETTWNNICRNCMRPISVLFETRSRVHFDKQNINAGMHDLSLVIDCYKRGLSNLSEPVYIEKLNNRAHILYKNGRNDLAVRDFAELVSIDGSEPLHWFFLGKSLFNNGMYEKALVNLNHTLHMDLNDDMIWDWMGAVSNMLGLSNSAQFYYKTALSHNEGTNLIELYTSLLLDLGKYSKAIKWLKKQLETVSNSRVIHRGLGISYHIIGEYTTALKHYDKALLMNDHNNNEDYGAFYSHSPLSEYMSKCASGFSLPMKNGWSHMKTPQQVIFRRDVVLTRALVPTVSDIAQQDMFDIHSNDGMFTVYTPNATDTIPPNAIALLEYCPRFMYIYHVNAIGFNSQARHLYAMSLAALDVAQVIRTELKRKQIKPSITWRMAYEIVVKWRSLCATNDAVFWSDESEIDDRNTRSRTYIIKETPVVRYYPYFDRGFTLLKEILVRRFPDRKERIIHAKDLRTVSEIIGENSYYAETSLGRVSSRTGKRLRGTGWVFEKKEKKKKPSKLEFSSIFGDDEAKEESAFDFSILTLHRPDRWSAFAAEIEFIWNILWSRMIQGYSASGIEGQIQRQKVTESVLQLAYYWYNFMPLTRGSAGVGMAMIQGLLLACGIDIARSYHRLPRNIQLDWEALLSEDPNSFVKIAQKVLSIDTTITDFSWTELPNVSVVVKTPRFAIALLNYAVDHSGLPSDLCS